MQKAERLQNGIEKSPSLKSGSDDKYLKYYILLQNWVQKSFKNINIIFTLWFDLVKMMPLSALLGSSSTNTSMSSINLQSDQKESQKSGKQDVDVEQDRNLKRDFRDFFDMV